MIITLTQDELEYFVQLGTYSNDTIPDGYLIDSVRIGRNEDDNIEGIIVLSKDQKEPAT